MGFFTLERKTIEEPTLDEELDANDQLVHESIDLQINQISQKGPIKNIKRSLQRQPENCAKGQENKIYYNSKEFEQFLQALVMENNNDQKSTMAAKEAKYTLISTINSLHEFAKATYRESKKPNNQEWMKNNKWEENSKKVASQAASEVINLIQLLGNDREKLNKFWTNIYTPLISIGGFDDKDRRTYTAGFMTELAVGYALKSKNNLSDDYEVYRATPEEDVKQGKDLIITNKKTGQEKPIQLKLIHGGGRDNDFIDVVKQLDPPEIRIVFGKTTDDLYDPITAQPTQKLIDLVRQSLLKEVI